MVALQSVQLLYKVIVTFVQIFLFFSICQLTLVTHAIERDFLK